MWGNKQLEAVLCLTFDISKHIGHIHNKYTIFKQINKGRPLISDFC